MKPFFIHPDQAAALAAIADEGSFEGAAYELGISTSAVSQRIRALDSGHERLDDGGAPVRVLADGVGPARDQHQHRRGAGGQHRLDQLALPAGEAQVEGEVGAGRRGGEGGGAEGGVAGAPDRLAGRVGGELGGAEAVGVQPG